MTTTGSTTSRDNGRLIRTVRREYTAIGRIPHEPCAHEDCSRTPHDRKPYCFEHVAFNTYAQTAGNNLEAYRREIELINAGQYETVEINASDAVHILKFQGPTTTGRLAKILDLDTKAALGFFKYLESERNLVTLTKHNRTYEIKAT